MDSPQERSGKSPEASGTDVAGICKRLTANKPVRHTLADGGRLHIDRQLPFLCVYRRPADHADAGTDQLVLGQAAYLIASGDRSARSAYSKLVRSVVGTLSEVFGAFLLIEVWSASPEDEFSVPEDALIPRPAIRVYSSDSEDGFGVVDALTKQLARITYQKEQVAVHTVDNPKDHPRRLRPMLNLKEARELGCMRIGVELRPFFRDPKTGNVFPEVLRAFRRGFDRSLRHAFFEFSRSNTPYRPPHFHALGRRAMVKAVWEVDERIAKVAESFDFLLQLTPVNADGAWSSFKRSGWEKIPALRYRPLLIDPSLLKRNLYNIPIEKIEDPAVGTLFREKQTELDRKLSMLLDRGGRDFLLASLQLFGGVDDALLRAAEGIIETNPARAREPARKSLDAEQLAERARAEIAAYQASWSEFSATVEIRSDVVAAAMVSNGNLFIGSRSKTPAARVEAILSHEIGTHLLTYYNASAQRFRTLRSGLAGYDELQEGLAVLAEYLTGGLSAHRLRVLAGRVIAVRLMVDGAGFVDTFRMLVRYGFGRRTAFTITLRTFRGGGLTKDAMYLRGLIGVLDYLSGGGELEPLYVGKMAPIHLPIIKELQWRKVLQGAQVMPRHLSDPDARARLEGIRAGVSLNDLAQ